MRFRTVLFILCAFMAVAFAATSVFADDVITERTGTIVIVTPDGTITTVGPNDPLPAIPSGSTISVVSGTITMAPQTGSYNVIIGDTVATVGAGDSGELGYNADGQVHVASTGGTIDTLTNGVEVSVPAGGAAVITTDPSGGVTVEAEGADILVTSPDGTTQTVAAGSTSTTQGTSAPDTDFDPETEQEIDNKDLEEISEISPAGE